MKEKNSKRHKNTYTQTKQIVLNMYRENVKTEDICRFTKLTKEEVDNIILSL